MNGKLYIVATPVGNLEDVSPRVLRILREVDLIAAEDTRHTGNLLHHFELKKPLVSYHQFSEAKRTAEFLTYFSQGKTIALVSDAGMPGVSDPGERLVRAAVQAGVDLEVIPGPSAPLLALTGSGFPMVPFYFGGFFPVKRGQRKKELAAAGVRGCTSVYFESPYRIVRLLEDAREVLPTFLFCLARELTKKFEQFQRGVPELLLTELLAKEPRGEYTVVISGQERAPVQQPPMEDR